jgi:hypothetical protein
MTVTEKQIKRLKIESGAAIGGAVLGALGAIIMEPLVLVVGTIVALAATLFRLHEPSRRLL